MQGGAAVISAPAAAGHVPRDECGLGITIMPSPEGSRDNPARASRIRKNPQETSVTTTTRRAALAATALAVAAPRTFAQAPIVIKFSHVVAADTPKGNGSEFFAKRAAELTKGRVKVEVYPNSQLYKDKEEMEALQLGSVQMLAPSVSKFAPLGVKEFEVFDFPYLFDSFDELHKVQQGQVGKGLLAKLEAKGISGLAFWDNGFKSFSSNRKMVVPEDVKGLKMRIQSSKVLEAQMRALGAIPQVMAFSEVYQALQTGVVDGTENPHSNLYSQKMNEVQKFVTITDHGFVGYAVVVNKKFWDGLPADIRGQLTQAMNEATKFTNDQAKKDNDDALAKVKATGKTEVLTLTAAQKAPWKKALVKVHKEMESRVGSEILQAVYKETGFNPAKL
jgi:C4-dicarboxylate-binding protein DctP